MSKHVTLFKIVMISLLMGMCFSCSYHQVNAFDPMTVPITEHGVVLHHGQTFNDRWGSETNHPPVDGSVDAWVFDGLGNELVTKGNDYWQKSKGSVIWTSGLLTQKWAKCTSFPLNGVDAYAIHPDTGEAYAHKGYLLFTMSATGECIKNGVDWRADWNSRASPSGQDPYDVADHIDAIQFIDAQNQVIITGNLMWIIGSEPAKYCNPNDQLPSVWKFCNPETLENRWVVREKMENHPPTDAIGLYVMARNPVYQISTYGEYIWELGKNGVWNTFGSGVDGYGMREPFWLKDGDLYYLYYDAEEPCQSWKTGIAVASHPRGPWKKIGLVDYVGTVRPWETEAHNAASVYKIGDKYYNIYLGAARYFGDDDNSQRYHVPGFDSGYYKSGLAVATSPQGPFTRIPGDGTSNPSSVNDPPLFNFSGGWHLNNFGSAQGTLLQFGPDYWYTYASSGTTGFGIGKAVAANILGPWTDEALPLLPSAAQSENAGVIYDQGSGYYFMFTNGVTKPPHDASDRWQYYWQGCGRPASGTTTEGAAIVMYWTKDPNAWDWQYNYRVLASSQGTRFVQGGIETQSSPLGCGGDSNYVPGKELKHRGNVGLGFPTYVVEEHTLYVAFDGNDFGGDYENKLKNHMFRDIYLLSIELPVLPPTELPGDIDKDSDVDFIDLLLQLKAMLGPVGMIFDYNRIIQQY